MLQDDGTGNQEIVVGSELVVARDLAKLFRWVESEFSGGTEWNCKEV